jgi:hypothetical protein
MEVSCFQTHKGFFSHGLNCFSGQFLFENLALQGHCLCAGSPVPASFTFLDPKSLTCLKKSKPNQLQVARVIRAIAFCLGFQPFLHFKPLWSFILSQAKLYIFLNIL